MHDQMETVAKTLIQHGKYNDRIYVMKYAREDAVQILPLLDDLSLKNDYAKICAKVPQGDLAIFLENGYQREASVPGFFQGREDGHFVGKYLKRARAENKEEKRQQKVLTAVKETTPEPQGPPDCSTEILGLEQAEEMAQIYRKVFASYPFPIFDPEYLAETMAKNSLYLGAWVKNRLAALAAIELDEENSSAEMTDFATLPEYRGKKLAYHLLTKMEDLLRGKKICTAYTIARAASFGMNITFGKRNYAYCGTLVNNTNISGKIESMNVWYKPLAQAGQAG